MECRGRRCLSTRPGSPAPSGTSRPCVNFSKDRTMSCSDGLQRQRHGSGRGRRAPAERWRRPSRTSRQTRVQRPRDADHDVTGALAAAVDAAAHRSQLQPDRRAVVQAQRRRRLRPDRQPAARDERPRGGQPRAARVHRARAGNLDRRAGRTRSAAGCWWVETPSHTRRWGCGSPTTSTCPPRRTFSDGCSNPIRPSTRA